MSESTVFDGPDAVRSFVWMQTMSKLALEINTGMRVHREPILAAMHRAGMIDVPLRSTKRNKINVLALMVEHTAAAYRAASVSWEPSATVTRALSS